MNRSVEPAATNVRGIIIDRCGHYVAEERTPAVQWAIFDNDPTPGFEARIKKMQWNYREQSK
jgi:hypothetical protein